MQIRGVTQDQWQGWRGAVRAGHKLLPLLLAELVLGTQGGQDGRVGAQAVALTASLQLLDAGQDLPLLKGQPLRPPPMLCPNPGPPPHLHPCPPQLPLTFLLFSKLMRSPWGQTLSELETVQTPRSGVEDQGQGLGYQEPHALRELGSGSTGKVKGERSGSSLC